MQRTAIYIPNPQEDLRTIDPDDNEYDQVAPDEIRSVSSESDLAESPAGHTIRSSYKSPIFDTPLEPCPVNGCPLNPQSGIIIPQSGVILLPKCAILLKLRISKQTLFTF